MITPSSSVVATIKGLAIARGQTGAFYEVLRRLAGAIASGELLIFEPSSEGWVECVEHRIFELAASNRRVSVEAIEGALVGLGLDHRRSAEFVTRAFADATEKVLVH